MKAHVIAQRDFSAGQLNETSLRADDTPIQRAGLRKASNVRILSTRGLKRRPGRRALFETSGITEVIRVTANDVWFLLFEAGRAVFVDEADTATRLSLGGMPWTAAQIETMRWVQDGTIIIVTHPAFKPVLMLYNVDSRTWSSSYFEFAIEPTNAKRAPFYNFSLGSGIKLAPSARSGSISVVASAPAFFPGHVGVIIRYAERQILVTNYVAANEVIGVVLEEVPPSFLVTVDNTTGLQAGDVVEGVTSGAKGQIYQVVSGTQFSVLVTKVWSGFSGTELIAGPRSRMTHVSSGSIPPVPSAIWDEELMSALRGWPSGVSKDQRRIIFHGFPRCGPGVTWSATGSLNDFKVGAEKDDAIFEFVPENCVVQDFIGGADEFVFTDRGVFYIPVSTSNPLIPGSVEFRLISDDPCAPIRPRQTTDGLVFVNQSLTRVLALIGTGQTARPYIVEDVSEFHTDLIVTPKVMCTNSSDVSAPERYLYVVNSDGGLAVARYAREKSGRGWMGWVPWTGAGKVKWVSSSGPLIVATVEYLLTSGLVRFVEVFDETMMLDAARPLASLTGASALTLSGGGTLTLSNGQPIELMSGYAFAWAPGSVVDVARGNWYRGRYTVAADGSLGDSIAVSDLVNVFGGFSFDVEIEPFVQHWDDGESVKQRLRRRRIKEVSATFTRSQALQIAGRLVPYYRQGENEEIAPPVRSETYRGRVLGRDYDPRWSIKQVLPGPLTLVELTTEVTF